MKRPPCKPDCPKRNAECHSTCPEYKTFREEKDIENDKILEKKLSNRSYNEYRSKVIHKCIKKRGNKWK